MNEIIELRRLVTKINQVMLDGLGAVDPWRIVGDPQFFPHACGVLPFASWEDVRPQCLKTCLTDPAKPSSGSVMVVGNYFASAAKERLSYSGQLPGFKRTWDGMRTLFRLARVSPSRFFLTNAYIGLPLKDVGHFPTNGPHTKACRWYLQKQIDLIKPSAIVAFGRDPAEFLAGMSDQLFGVWSPWPNFRFLDERGLAIIRDARFGSSRANAVVVIHPWVPKRDRTFEGKTGWDAEAGMVRRAANL